MHSVLVRAKIGFMEKIKLSELERNAQKQMWQGRPSCLTVSPWIVFLMALVFPPFLLISSLFDPLIGALISGVGLLFSAMYLYLERSWFIGVISLLGIFCSILLLKCVHWVTMGKYEGLVYLAIGFAPAFSLGFLVLSSMGVWAVLQAKACSAGAFDSRV
jgi:hypothetical protein